MLPTTPPPPLAPGPRHRTRCLLAVVVGVLSAVGPAAESVGAATGTTERGGAVAPSTVRRPSPPVPMRSSTTTTLPAVRTATGARPTTTLRAGATTTVLRAGATSTTRRGGSTTTGATSSTSSTTTTLPPDLKTEIELAIVDGQKAAAPGLKVTRATCPVSLKVPRSQAKAGTYECTVVIEGVAAPYTVIISRADKARTGTYALSPAKAIIDTAKVVAGIREDLDPSERATAKISCGRAKVIVAAPGSQISCSTTTGTLTMPVRYTVKDLEGTIALVTE